VDKAVKMDYQTDLFTKELLEATFDLAESLAEAEAIVHFISANQALNNDQNTLELVNAATDLQRKLYDGESSGDDLNNDLNRLRDYQSQISSNAVIQEQSIARETAVAFLREINQEISQLLGMDFAALARRPGAGC
jgi:cell fate (sporulation/competence/biofilm development) regulator YlbF (YheA/YmcA/DUF963 family)